MSTDPSSDKDMVSPLAHYKQGLFALGVVTGLALLLALLLPATQDELAKGPSRAMLDTLSQAESRLTEHFSDGDFSTVNSEVMRQVAFSGQGQPVHPALSLQVRGGTMVLGATPILEGRGFALIVERASKAECEKISSAYAEDSPQINGRTGELARCLRHGNLIRIEVVPALGRENHENQ